MILGCDSYKHSHGPMYPKDTKAMFCYLEPRAGKEIVFYGLQPLIHAFESNPITLDYVREAEWFCSKHFGRSDVFNPAWYDLARDYEGKLPVRIRAVPEGTVVPSKNVILTVESTDPKYYWLPTFLETMIVQLWYPCTVATISRHAKQIIKRYLEQTGNVDLLPFKLHDFGYRGVSSEESAAIGGSAHLINFQGTDTLTGIAHVMEHYFCDKMPGFSIPAAEHSTVISWGKEHEVDSYRNMLQRFGDGLVAVVSDSYDIDNAITNLWGGVLKQEVLDMKGQLVIRLDSGSNVPKAVLHGLELIGQAFGTYENSKGYKVLNDKVRVLQGDGMNLQSLESVCHLLKMNKWSIDNVAFGMGGGLLQKCDRDTYSFAYKPSAVNIEGKGWVNVSKSPKDAPEKASKSGLLRLIKVDGKYQTVANDLHSVYPDELVTIYDTGKIMREWTFDQIRERAKL